MSHPHEHNGPMPQRAYTRGMSANARGTRACPGKRIRQKAGLNRSLRDAAFGAAADYVPTHPLVDGSLPGGASSETTRATASE